MSIIKHKSGVREYLRTEREEKIKASEGLAEDVLELAEIIRGIAGKGFRAKKVLPGEMRIEKRVRLLRRRLRRRRIRLARRES